MKVNPNEPKAITQLQAIFEHFPFVQFAVLFGSFAKDKVHLNSDIDIAVKASHPLSTDQLIALTESIATVFNRPVDLVDLTTVGQPLLDQIISSGIQIVGPRSYWGDLVFRNIIDNEDFVPYQKRILEGRRKAWINN
ncbi:MAG: nucleotidyltransferase domain-containing protein [Oceanospirillales bacterium]|nr:MAG: nucleotidyltransferase domain-containing protein [Oceanospirillales bacterium]